MYDHFPPPPRNYTTVPCHDTIPSKRVDRISKTARSPQSRQRCAPPECGACRVLRVRIGSYRWALSGRVRRVLASFVFPLRRRRARIVIGGDDVAFGRYQQLALWSVVARWNGLRRSRSVISLSEIVRIYSWIDYSSLIDYSWTRLLEFNRLLVKSRTDSVVSRAPFRNSRCTVGRATDLAQTGTYDF